MLLNTLFPVLRAIVVFVLISPIFLYISFYAYLYYTRKYEIDAAQQAAFMANLSFPVRYIFARTYQFFSKSYDVNKSAGYYYFQRALAGLIPLLLTLFASSALIRPLTYPLKVSYLSLSVLSLIFLVVSYRFGHSLRNEM